MTKIKTEQQEDGSWKVSIDDRVKEEYKDIFTGKGSTIAQAMDRLFSNLLAELREREDFPGFLFFLIKDIMLGRVEDSDGNPVSLDEVDIIPFTTVSAYGVPFWRDYSYLTYYGDE